MFSRAKAWWRQDAWQRRADEDYRVISDGIDRLIKGQDGIRYSDTSTYEQEQIALLQRIDQEEREQEDHR